MSRTVEEIEIEMSLLEREREILKVKLRGLEAERNEAVAAAELAKLSPAKIRALAKLIGVKGIPSAEAVGKVGG